MVKVGDRFRRSSPTSTFYDSVWEIIDVNGTAICVQAAGTSFLGKKVKGLIFTEEAGFEHINPKSNNFKVIYDILNS